MLYFFISFYNKFWATCTSIESVANICLYKIMDLHQNFIKLYKLAMISAIKAIFSCQKTCFEIYLVLWQNVEKKWAILYRGVCDDRMYYFILPIDSKYVNCQKYVLFLKIFRFITLLATYAKFEGFHHIM